MVNVVTKGRAGQRGFNGGGHLQGREATHEMMHGLVVTNLPLCIANVGAPFSRAHCHGVDVDDMVPVGGMGCPTLYFYRIAPIKTLAGMESSFLLVSSNDFCQKWFTVQVSIHAMLVSVDVYLIDIM